MADSTVGVVDQRREVFVCPGLFVVYGTAVRRSVSESRPVASLHEIHPANRGYSRRPSTSITRVGRKYRTKTLEKTRPPSMLTTNGTMRSSSSLRS